MTEDEPTDSTKLVVILGDEVPSIQTVVRGLPANPPYGVVVVAPQSKDLIARLTGANALPVTEVTSTVALERGQLYVVHPHVEVTLHRSTISTGPLSSHGSRDRLLRSVADHFGPNATIVMLASHDHDGALGVKRVREAGGITICERIEDAVDGLPRAAMETGMVDIIVPVGEVASRIGSAFDVPVVIGDTAEKNRAEDTLRDILTMIRIRTGHDFSSYKRATLYRRLARRMQVCQKATIVDYQRLLREHPNELLYLLRDFLISVTNFFRDPEAFAELATHVIPRLFKDKGSQDQVRVWVTGCATGEEAYSIGMLLLEHASRVAEPPHLQVFATDIDEEALQEARMGIYPEQIATDVSVERLQRFFVRENGGYRVCNELRELMLFSPHNVLRDPPFSRLDLITCRNLLIYLNREAQERVLNTFHFALKPDGLLFLGSSESADGTEQFSPFDAKNRIFARRIAPAAIITDTLVRSPRWSPPRAPYPASERPTITSFGELHHRAVEQYAPPSAVVNEEFDIVHMSENVGKYFELSGGEPTRQILRLVHPALRFALRGALQAARQPGRRGDTRTIKFEDGGTIRWVEIRVRAIELPETGRGTMLVMFDELDAPREVHAVEPGSKMEPVLREMEEELHRTRDELRTTIEQYETSVEELNASNEELHAMNEELRSATEELETSKEELQSVNEELTTLNHELKVKIDEVTRANSDVQNLMTSTDIGVLFLDRQLRIKRFTPRIQDLFNVIASDHGRALSDLTHRLGNIDLAQAAQRVLADLHSTERQVSTNDGRRFLVRLLPYRSIDDRIEGVVMTFVDVSDLKAAQEARTRSEAALRTSEERLTLALNAAPLAVISHDTKLVPTWAFVHGKQLNSASLTAAKIFADRDAERYQAIVSEVYATGLAQRAELDVITAYGVRTYDFRIEATYEGQLVTGITSVGFDISPSKRAEATLRESDRRKDEFLAMLSHELRNPLTPLRVAFDVARLTQNDPKQLAESLAVIDRQLHVLVRLVDDLLDLSRISQGKIDLVSTRLDPVRIAEAALESSRPFIEERRHKVTVKLETEGALVVGDSTRLAQMLTNLLLNAAKYTPEGGKLSLSMTTARDPDRLVIAVRDNGIGIAAADVHRVFDMFVQSHASEGRRDGGMGIGLSLVRRIAELHGGTARVESEGAGTGSTFIVELPLVRET